MKTAVAGALMLMAASCAADCQSSLKVCESNDPCADEVPRWGQGSCRALEPWHGCAKLVDEFNTCKECTCRDYANGITPPPAPVGKCTGKAKDGSCISGLAEAQIEAIVAEHNKYRALHCAPPLTYDTTIENWCASSAGMMATCSTGNLTHNKDGPYGENIMGGLTQGDMYAYNSGHAARNWYCGEEGCYDYSKPGYSDDTGHFTAMVWKASTKIGCCQCQRDGSIITMCNYGPAGNVAGGYEQNVADPKKTCDEETHAPRTPEPMPASSEERYVGCYVDAGSRDLGGAVSRNVVHASISTCRDFCTSDAAGAPFKYFGLQYAKVCFCGNSFGRYGAASEQDCNMKCAADATQTCGGGWRNSVYEVVGN